MTRRSRQILAVVAVWLGLHAYAPVCAARMPLDLAGDAEANKSLTLDGSAVLTAGHFHMNITNWGLLGSQYSVPSTYFGAPSGQWPGGSGEEYIFSAGLWIGGAQFGVYSVSSGQPESELRPPHGTEYVMYEARERSITRPYHTGEVVGTPGDLAGGDDDGDGLSDEDRLDGRDNDGDGRTDEDFAQRGAQMYSCIMRDDDPINQQMFPDHRPLNLEIFQEACAWDTPGHEDAIGLRWEIKNVGPQPIHDIYVGFLVDGDLGLHDDPDAGKDDIAGTFDGLVRQRGNYYEDFAYAWMRDVDANYALPGILAVELDGSGFGDVRAVRPQQHGVNAIRVLNADFTQGYGGIPYLDTERYELLSRPGRDRDVNEVYADDYVVLLSVGPYEILNPGEHITVLAWLTVGVGQENLHLALREARDLARGRWYNADYTYASGRGGAETMVCAEDFGLPWNALSNPLYRRFASYWNEECKPEGMAAGFPIESGDLFWDPDTDKHCIWVSTDNCEECERQRGSACDHDHPGAPYCWGSSVRVRNGCTSYGGRETRVPYVTLVDLPPPPMIRIQPVDRGMEIYWDDRSELYPDVNTGIDDFESYRVWRADEWDRPAGTSEETGPPVLTWDLLAEYDVVNFYTHAWDEFPRSFGYNTGLDVVSYRPICLDDPEYDGLAEVMEEVVLADTQGDMEVLPPLRDVEGTPTPGLEDLLPWEDHRAELDTFFAVTERPAEVGVPKDATGYYMYRDGPLHNGFIYFYAVTATDHLRAANGWAIQGQGSGTLPSGSFGSGTPRFQAGVAGDPQRQIYAYPNPATRESLAQFQALHPNADDPTGVRISFANLPACQSTIQIFTLAGDLVQTVEHDGSYGDGQAYWNLTTRNGQEVTSGIFLFVVQPKDGRYENTTGKFVVVR